MRLTLLFALAALAVVSALSVGREGIWVMNLVMNADGSDRRYVTRAAWRTSGEPDW